MLLREMEHADDAGYHESSRRRQGHLSPADLDAVLAATPHLLELAPSGQ